MIILCAALCTVLAAATGQNDVIFASLYDHQDLATRITCQVEESQHFEYASVTELWGSMGGNIVISADVILHCLGDDQGGKYGTQALKYRVEVINLQMTAEDSKVVGVGGRKKRGAKEFFSNSWKKVKKFFNRMLGRTTEESTRASHDDAGGSGTSSDEEEEEVFLSAEETAAYSTPFQMVQLANGSIPEIRFSENEVEDGRVRNFKRHLVDVFATQLDSKQKRGMESSLMGDHNTTYNITVTEGLASLNLAGWGSTVQPHDQGSASVVVVEKIVMADDIVKLAPSPAINDKDKMELKAQQMQVFRNGRMVSSSGTSSLHLGDSEKTRVKRHADDVTSYIHTHTAYDIQLKERHLRTKRESINIHKENTSFKPAPRTAEVDDSHERKNLQTLQKSMNLKLILEDLISNKDIDQEIQTLYEIVEREVSLKLDDEENSLSCAIRNFFTIEKMEDLCTVRPCKDYLQLMALTGGSLTEKMFLHLLKNTRRRPFPDVRVIADILSDIPHPSGIFLSSLGDLMIQDEKLLGPDGMGSLCISLSILASRAMLEVRDKVSSILSNMLVQRPCHNDSIFIDILEAAGNLRCEMIIPSVLKVSAECRHESAVQIACAHALRHSSHMSSVQSWIHETVEKGDCDVIKEVVGSLMDKIQDQEITPDITSWPRHHFNSIDALFQKYLDEEECSTEVILLYFSKKKNAQANAIARNHFVAEPWKPRSRHRRRAPWDDLNCQEWTEDSRYTPIQDKDEFSSDRDTYNKRKSCLAFRKFGVKGANAEIYAGMFAGVKEPSDPPKYKLFTKFVSGVNFLGHQVEIGSFYFYLHSGMTKAYIRILGQTRQEFTHQGCTPTDVRYRPLKHIPLYLVSIGNVQLSLGVHLSSRLSVDTLCPDTDVYQLQPLTSVRIGGEALGTLLFMRGAANIGADFNYKLQFTFTPSPGMCLKGSHGFDPMNINFETYYQLWNGVKQEWGKSRKWKPSFLSWEMGRGAMKQWFDDTCIASMDLSAEKTLKQRELE